MGLFQLLQRLFFNNMLIGENTIFFWGYFSIPNQIIAGNQSILHSVETSLDAVVVSALAVAVDIDSVFPR